MTLRLSLAVGAVSLAGIVTPTIALAASSAFVEPAEPSVYARSYQVATTDSYVGGSVLGADGVTHAVFETGNSTLGVCSVPRGSRTCSTTATLATFDANLEFFGNQQIFEPSPGVIDVVAYNCCERDQVNTIYLWSSINNGATFGAPVALGNLYGLSSAVIDGSDLVAVATGHDGVEELSVPLDGSGTATPFQQISGDEDDAAVTSLPHGAVIVANDDAPVSTPYTTNIEFQASVGGAPTLIQTFPGESIRSLVTGSGGTYLLTRADTSALDPPVLVRKWNGSSFGAAHTVPVPGPGDDARFALTVGAGNRIDVTWIGARDSYRLWHAVSTNGGDSFTTQLLGNGILAENLLPNVDVNGIGTVVELGGNGVVVQPLLVTPTISLKATPGHLYLGKKTVLSGVAKPGLLNYKVTLQEQNGKHWSTVATGKENVHGAFSFKLTPRKLGTAVYRIYVDGRYGSYDIATSNSTSVTTKALPAT